MIPPQNFSKNGQYHQITRTAVERDPKTSKARIAVEQNCYIPVEQAGKTCGAGQGCSGADRLVKLVASPPKQIWSKIYPQSMHA